MSSHLISRHKLLLCLVVLFSLLTRFWRLQLPAKTYFDEAYHVPAARLIANNDERAYEWWHQPIVGEDYHDWLHPPLVKLIQASSIRLFGDNSLGWRIPSAVFGVLLILAIYSFSYQLFRTFYSKAQSRKIALLSCALATLDGLVLVQSRIAMNDIFVCFWMIVALFLATAWQPKMWLLKLDRFKQKEKETSRHSNVYLLATGIILGLALASKWSAILLMLAILTLTVSGALASRMFKSLPLIFFSLFLLPIFIYFLSYSQMFAQGKDINYFFRLHEQILWYQTNRDTNHNYSSLPHQWLLNNRPVWYWTDDHNDSVDESQKANIYALGNPVIQVLALFALIYRLGELVICWNHEKKLSFKLSTLLLFMALWLPWILSPRIIFYHLYLPAFLILNLILSDILIDVILRKSSKAFWLIIMLVVISFIIFYPHWIGIAVDKQIVERVYYAFPSWK